MMKHLEDEAKRSGARRIMPRQDLSPALVKRFEELSKLEHNWDGEGGEPPIPRLLVWARFILGELCQSYPEPEVNPVDDGRLDLIWFHERVYAVLDTTSLLFSGFVGPTDEIEYEESDGVMCILKQLRTLLQMSQEKQLDPMLY